MDNKVHILIADDHKLFAEGLAALIATIPETENAGIAGSALEALSILRSRKVDLLISDIQMPGMSGLDLVKEVKQKFPDVKVLVVSMYCEPEVVEEIFDAEAEGYILKDATYQEFSSAIRQILDNGTYFSNKVMEMMLRRIKKEKKQKNNLVQLSPRELEILQLIIQEYSSEQIAEKLFISKRTVDTHRKNILYKTNSQTLVGLIRYAFENGLVP
ncbi:MAG: response regulator transcription factor [Bacteroidetes bacterium]|nr:response regulator transcription factor [Bacteroidota bacterium]